MEDKVFFPPWLRIIRVKTKCNVSKTVFLLKKILARYLIWKQSHLVNIWLMQLQLVFMSFHFFFFFFSVLSESWNIFRVFTQWPLTFLPVSCRIDVGHNDYGYQQPSYPEQGYDRPYEDSSQHYYEGGIYIPSHTYTYISPSTGTKILA